MLKDGLSLIIPVYNEEQGIGATLNSIVKLVSEFSSAIEVIFVDDGSTDGTSALLQKKITENSKIKLITHSQNRGYGAALKTGIRNSNFNYICITDADETYPNHRIPEFLEKTVAGDFDMIVGARVGSKAKIPLIRKPAKWALNRLANYLAEYKIPDLNSGLRIMKRDVLLKFLHILPEGFSFTTTITLAMLTNGYHVNYEPIEYFHRAGNSKIRPIYDTANFIQLIIRTVLLFRPLKIFLPISFFMFFCGLALVFYRFMLGEAFSVTATVIFMGAIQMLAIGMLADLIDRRLEK